MSGTGAHGVTRRAPLPERDIEIRKRTYRYRPFLVGEPQRERASVGLVLWDTTEHQQLQDQLIQAEKLASLGTLVSGMAHEVNNPIQGIMSMAEIIVHESDLERVKEYARDIVTYSEHVGVVVKDFACYARPASRDQEVDLDVNERLGEALKLVQRSAQFGHVMVTTTFRPLPRLRARRSEIDQVFVNLISNAVDAMEGRGRLTLETACDDDTMRIHIQDTGSGIPPALLGKIFDPFMTTKDPGKGTGLGLSIAYKIISKYEGGISVESEELKGTAFTIKFPVS
jgi:two-component system NtrC family sensor kinase